MADGQGINIGDAVLTFIGDASQLEQALNQVNSSAQSKLAPAKDEAQKLGAAIDETGQAAKALQAAFDNAAKKTVDYTVATTTLKNTLRAMANGELPICDATVKALSEDMQKATAATVAKTAAMNQVKAALTATATAETQVAVATETEATAAKTASSAQDQHTRSLTEARLAAQLAGQELGIRMPRALTTIAARSEAIGPILNAAFSGIAIVGFIELAVTAGQKLGELISDMFIFTQAEKDAQQAGIALNKVFLDNAEKQSQLEAEHRTNTHTAVENTKHDLQEQKDAIVKITTAYDNQKAAVAALEAAQQKQIATQKANLAANEKIDPGSTNGLTPHADAGTVQQLDAARNALTALGAQLKTANDQLAVFSDKSTDAVDKSNDAAVKSAQQAAAAQLAAWTKELQSEGDQRDAFHQMSAQDEANFWAGKLLMTKQGSDNATAVYHAMVEAQKKADEEAAQSVVAAMHEQIAATKSGTSERVAAEQKLTEFVRATWGENSKEYQHQLNAQTAATREYNDAQIRLANQLALIKLASEQKLTKDSIAAGLKYFEAQYQQGQITYAQLVELKRQALQQEYQLDVDALNQAINELDPSKIAERKKLEGELKLAKQKETEAEKALDQQAADTSVLIEEKKQLEIKKLRAQNGVAGAIFTDTDEKRLEKVNGDLTKLQLTIGKVSSATKVAEAVFKTLGIDTKLLDLNLTGLQRGALAVAGAVATMAEAWSQGGITMAQAAEKTAAAVLQSLAQMAFAKGTEQIAIGLAVMGDPFSLDTAGHHFASAAEWFAAGGVASVAAGAINSAASGGGGGSSSKSSADSGVSVAPGDAAPAANPVQTVNVQRFATGAVFTKPTLLSPATMRMVGDSISGGAADEAVIPLEDPRALKKIAAALGPHLAAMGGGDTHIHMPNVRGVISADVMDKVIDKMNTRVNGGKKLVASHARRLEKR